MAVHPWIFSADAKDLLGLLSKVDGSKLEKQCADPCSSPKLKSAVISTASTRPGFRLSAIRLCDAPFAPASALFGCSPFPLPTQPPAGEPCSPQATFDSQTTKPKAQTQSL